MDNNYFIKYNVSPNEYKIQMIVSKLNIVDVPEIIDYDATNHTMKMRRINNMNLSDFYGENAKNVPIYIFDKIRAIIKKLLLAGIEYPDITGYNFIEHNNKIWIIDFGHASFFVEKYNCSFITKFINGLNEWNPNFK